MEEVRQIKQVNDLKKPDGRKGILKHTSVDSHRLAAKAVRGPEAKSALLEAQGGGPRSSLGPTKLVQRYM